MSLSIFSWAKEAAILFIQDYGEPIIYRPYQDADIIDAIGLIEPVEMVAIFSPNAVEPVTNLGVANSYEHHYHFFSIPVTYFIGFKPGENDIIEFKEKEFVVRYIKPTDQDNFYSIGAREIEYED